MNYSRIGWFILNAVLPVIRGDYDKSNSLKSDMLSLEEKILLKSLKLEKDHEDDKIDLSTDSCCIYGSEFRFIFVRNARITNSNAGCMCLGFTRFENEEYLKTNNNINNFITIVADKRFANDEVELFRLCKDIIEIYIMKDNNFDNCYNILDKNIQLNYINSTLATVEYCRTIFVVLDEIFNLKYGDFDRFVKDRVSQYNITENVLLTEDILREIYDWSISDKDNNTTRDLLVEKLFEYNFNTEDNDDSFIDDEE
jgi:hypothetical protein